MKNLFHLYLERVDPRQNMHRFYALELELTLFGEISVTRRWGRIGSHGRSAVAVCEDEKEALALFLDLARRKIRRKYQPPRTADEGRGGEGIMSQPFGQPAAV